MYLDPIDNMAFDVNEFIKPLSFIKKLTDVEIGSDGNIHIYLTGTTAKDEEYHFVVCKETRCTIHIEHIIGSDWLLNVNCCDGTHDNKIWRLLKRRGFI